MSASTLNSDGASITVENGSLNAANLNANGGSITVEENGSIKANNLQAQGVTYTQHGKNGIRHKTAGSHPPLLTFLLEQSTPSILEERSETTPTIFPG